MSIGILAATLASICAALSTMSIGHWWHYPLLGFSVLCTSVCVFTWAVGAVGKPTKGYYDRRGITLRDSRAAEVQSFGMLIGMGFPLAFLGFPFAACICALSFGSTVAAYSYIVEVLKGESDG